jgi:hypothetical protein
MDTNKYPRYLAADFVQDDSFINWVLNPNEISDQFWIKYINNHPEQKNMIDKASFIIRSISRVREPQPPQKLNEILSTILTQSSKRSKTIYLKLLKYAAMFLLLFTIGESINFLEQSHQVFPIAENTPAHSEKGLVILADGKTHEFDTENTSIQQASLNQITINSDTIKTTQKKTNTQTQLLTKVIIPYGKRSEITLCDGTHVWLNSGSQLSFPSEFEKNSREVYLTGEAFFDVTENVSKPFFVITPEIKVRVMGTCFNIMSYSDDQTVQTVLLKGKVSVGRNKLFTQSMELIPGERITYQKAEELLIKDNVNVQLFSSWVKGFLIFENEPITVVFKKLERFYNQKITTEGGLNKITFSGKLDLKNNIKKVLTNIAFASSVVVTEENSVYYITQ